MSIERPPAVRVVAMDPKTGKSKTITVYNTTPEQVVDFIRGGASSENTQPREKSTPTAA